MVDRLVVQTRIAKLREYVALLERVRGLAEPDAFAADPLIYGNAERYLQLAIQAVLDISNHVVADMRLSLPPDSRSLFRVLVSHNILTAALAGKLTTMAGFRNILVHDYLEIDRRRVYEVLRKDLGDFEDFIAAVNRLL